MPFRGSRLVAVLVPVAVAIIPVSLLIWYDVTRIPSQETYLNQRNQRLLTTLSGAITTKIDSFDGALDNAVKSFDFKGPDAESDFKKRFTMFARDLAISEVRVKGADELALKNEQNGGQNDTEALEQIDREMLDAADDPPMIRVRRDEGRYYLHLGAKLEDHGQTTWISAYANLDTALAPVLDHNPDFAAILVATDTGEVIAHNSRVGLTLSRLDGVIGPPPGAAAKDPKPLSAFSSTDIPSVTIGGVAYKPYLQTIPLSLLNSKKSDDGSRQPAEWLLCGLVLEERFATEAAALSFTTLLWFSGFLAIIALALPFVKLRVVSARERLRASDTRLVTATTLMAVGLLTFAGLGALTFGRWFGKAVDTRLQSVADSIAHNVDAEVTKIERQGASFESYLNTHKTFTNVTNRLSKEKPFPLMTIKGDEDPPSIKCSPEDACRSGLVSATPKKEEQHIPTDDYPFFDFVTWAGDDGWQRVRWTSGRDMRPFVNIIDQGLPYAQSAKDAWDSMTSRIGADVISSATTGDPLTVFWRATSETSANRIQSLAATTLVSLDHPVLPKGMSFAIVDRKGKVLFHSIANRRLQENFLTECEDDIRLRALLQSDGADGDDLSVSYRGHDQRVHVQPLKLGSLTGTADPGWHLVVFQDSAIRDTLNLETITVASELFGMYLGILAILATLIHIFVPWQPKWFWPDPGKQPAYRAAALLNVRAIVAFVPLLTIGTALEQPELTLIAVAALILRSAVATYRTIVRAPRESNCRDPFTWRHPFFRARAAFLLVIAGLPAIACFNVAYWFEGTLLTNEETVQQRADLTHRSDRITLKAAQLGHEEMKGPLQTELWKLISHNTHPPLWFPRETPQSGELDYPAPPLKTVGTAAFSRGLMALHRRYNDIAGDLESSADPTAAWVTSPLLSGEWPVAVMAIVLIGWLFAIILALFAACFAFVYWLVKPMFALQAVAPPLPPAADSASGRVLQIGPFGSGKSTNLPLVLKSPTRKIIDVVTVGWIVAPVAAQAAVGASGGIDAPRATLGSVTDVTELGIDHVDYRIEEPAFAAQTLTLIEQAMYSGVSHVRIVCDRDPIASLQESSAPAADVDRWVRALRSCRKEIVRVDGSTSVRSTTTAPPSSNNAAQAVLDEACGIPALDPIASKLLLSVQSADIEEALASFGAAASPYYESLWRGCTEDERLTLHQLAEEGVVNPQNLGVVRNLMRTGLIVRDPIVRIMNSTFREFVIQAASAEQVSTWERRGVVIPWTSIELAMLSVVLILAILLVGTQRQLIHAWFGVVPMLLPAGQKAFDWITGLWAGSKARAAA